MNPDIPIIILRVNCGQDVRIEAYALADVRHDPERLRAFIRSYVEDEPVINVIFDGPMCALRYPSHAVVTKICPTCGERGFPNYCGSCGADLRGILPTVTDKDAWAPVMATDVPDPPRIVAAMLWGRDHGSPMGVRPVCFWIDTSVRIAELQRLLDDAADHFGICYQVTNPLVVESLPRELRFARPCKAHGMQEGARCRVCREDLSAVPPSLGDPIARLMPESIFPAAAERTSVPPFDALLLEGLRMKKPFRDD